MKKLFALLLAAVLVVGLMTACGSEGSDETTNTTESGAIVEGPTNGTSGDDKPTGESTESETVVSGANLTEETLPATNGDLDYDGSDLPASDGDLENGE